MPVKTEMASMDPPPPANSGQPGVTRSLLYNGSRFQGHQKSKGQSYDVEVVLQHVDEANSYLCGYLKIKGLTEEYPTLTTFFDGEIISAKFPFLTRKWDADEEVDKKHWCALVASHSHQLGSQAKFFPVVMVTSSGWPGYMPRTVSLLHIYPSEVKLKPCLSLSYWEIVYDAAKAHRAGYQSLNLTHVPEHSVQIYEFR
ncbi:glucose-induced degradation protein 4 homolog [Penaeus indicus]|uniref:glucose-induced degradation protein 4 homolog n=1 Tax=Penaeus indicus TaxID=29960 RepID=UPI00300D149C